MLIARIAPYTPLRSRISGPGDGKTPIRFIQYLATLLLVCLVFNTPVSAQDASATPPPDRSATGGAPTLEDILARQRGEKVDLSYRAEGNDDDGAAAMAAKLGTLGGASDSEVFRVLRYGTADVTVTSRGPAAGVLIQDGGMRWLEVRDGPLSNYGTWLLGGTLFLLVLFYLLRSKIRIDGLKTGQTILHFTSFERFGHWLFAGSFLILGLIVLFGRKVLIPAFGHEAFSIIAIASKWIHNNVAWAFMVGLILIILNWTFHNIPNRHDLVWLAKAGGLFSNGVHPPARKFNAGQKIIFWSCAVLGLSISASGLSLLFPLNFRCSPKPSPF